MSDTFRTAGNIDACPSAGLCQETDMCGMSHTPLQDKNSVDEFSFSHVMQSNNIKYIYYGFYELSVYKSVRAIIYTLIRNGIWQQIGT